MDVSRRNILKVIGTACMMGPLSPGMANVSTGFSKVSVTELIKPKKLSPGQTIGLVSPAGAAYESEPYEIATEALQAMGLKVKEGKFLRGRYGHLAGKDEERAKEFNKMFKDPSIDAIICLRGGSGAARILDKIDYKMIGKNPKILVGYSDITALLLAVYTRTGLVTFHGPVAISSWSGFTYDYFRRLLFEGEQLLFQNPPKAEGSLVQTENRIRTIVPGKAQGILAGGNLAVLSGLVGTGYLPSWEGKILFLEDIREKIYRIDRMMTQLKLAGVLNQISGFVFGKCTRCYPDSGYGSLTLEEVIDDYIKPLGIPAYSGAMIGHVEDKFTLPLGIRVEMDADRGAIKMLETAVK